MTHEIRNKNSINTSTSKQQFAFSKADRFMSPKAYTNAFGYEMGTQFGQKKGGGIGFGKTESRFGYEEMKKEQRGLGKIETPDTVETLSRKPIAPKFSFGVSRSNMKKLHVDEILKKREENLPGPDRYNDKPRFGSEARTVAYSMRKNLGAYDRELGREKRLPGPGYYDASNLTG